jgi:hypothetical protein
VLYSLVWTKSRLGLKGVMELSLLVNQARLVVLLMALSIT